MDCVRVTVTVSAPDCYDFLSVPSLSDALLPLSNCILHLRIQPVTLLGMVPVFQENRVRIHVKFVFAWKTCKLFPM